MKKFFVLSLLSVIAFAQQNDGFRLNFDIAKFRGDDTHTYVELYYSFDVSLLHYVPSGDGQQGEAVVHAVFKRSSDDSIAGNQAWRIPFSITDTSVLASSRLYSDIFGFMLAPDVYRVYLTASDMNDASVHDSVSFVLEVNAYASGTPLLSDPELCTSIVPAEKDSTNRFYKNTFDVKANASKIFGSHQPILFYYLEAYGLTSFPNDRYYTRAVVKNGVGKEVINQERMKRRVHDSNVEVGMLKVHELRTGAYTFTYSIFDSATRTGYASSKRFFIFNPNLPMDTLVAGGKGNIDATVFATMSEEELDKEIQYIRYIATREELNRFDKLSGVDAKRRALYDFWQSRNEDQNSPVNGSRTEYLQRVAYANEQFRTGYRDGWRTDRGRVYIVYGPYDEIERHANESDMKPYEIWYYHSIQGGVEFIFGDRSGFSDYVLLHSTHRNEIQDMNWQSQLRAN